MTNIIMTAKSTQLSNYITLLADNKLSLTAKTAL